MNRPLVVPKEAWAFSVVEAIVSRLPNSNQPAFHIALPGGSTPKAFFPRLVAELSVRPGPLAKMRFWFGDERGVPHDHAESNAALAWASLLSPLGIAGEHVHRMPADRLDREVAALQHDREFPENLDLLILGLGEDGHYASVFPGSPTIRETRRRVVTAQSPAGVVARMTITPRVVAEARSTLVVAAGANKAAAVRAAWSPVGSVERTPARQIRNAQWIIDEAAASLFSGNEST